MLKNVYAYKNNICNNIYAVLYFGHTPNILLHIHCHHVNHIHHHHNIGYKKIIQILTAQVKIPLINAQSFI